MASLSSRQDELTSNLSDSEAARTQLQEELKIAQERSQAELTGLLDRLDAKTRAG